MRITVLFVFLGASSVCPANDKVKLPAEAKFSAGDLIDITVEVTGEKLKEVIWRVPPEIKYKTCAQGLSLTGVCKTPGRYPILFISAVADQPIVAECIVVIEGSPVIPPRPNPPVPVDPLLAEITALYNLDTAPNKAEISAKLAALYRLAIRESNDPANTTAGKLIAVIRDAGNTLVGSGLASVRKLVASELGKLLPSDVTLTIDHRLALAKLFERLAIILESLK